MTTAPDEPHAPGCFGSALAFKPMDPHCVACPFMSKCEPAASSRREILAARYGIKTLPRRIPRPTIATPTPTQEPGEMVLSKHVQDLIGRIERSGVAVVDNLRKGVNPFGGKPMFLRLACHLLLRMEHGFTRELLTHAYMTKLGWTKTTAQPHVTLAFKTLTAIGATIETNGRLILKGW